VDAVDGPLYLIAIIRPRMEWAAEVEAELRALMAGTNAEEGCIHMELVVSEDDPTTWLMLEKFRSRLDWEQHMRTAHVTRGNARLVDLLREPTELRFYSAK
jgi:quinol monooxygenase YgiN